MKLTVHIGLHKTGTTSIQHALRSNRETLRRSGVLYPTAGEIEAGGHLNLVWESINAWKYSPSVGGFKQLTEEIKASDAEHVLISAESFSGYYRRPEVISVVERLGKELNASPNIVCTVRPQFSLIDSLYAQNASTGYTSLDFVNYSLMALANDTLDFEVLLGRWFDSFGKVTLVPVERGVGTPLIDRFLEAANVKKPSAFAEVTPANLRASVRTVEFGRKACELLDRTSVDAATKHRIIGRLRRQVLNDYPSDPAFSGLTLAHARLISRHFSARNADFVKKRNGGQKIFGQPVEAYKFKRSCVSLDALASEERDYFETALLRASGIGASPKRSDQK